MVRALEICMAMLHRIAFITTQAHLSISLPVPNIPTK